MNKFLAVAVMLLGLVSAKAADTLYEVRCPACLDKQILAAVSVASQGGYSTNFHGVSGTMQQRNGAFHCPACHTDFNAPIKPDQFVPSLDATPVARAMSTNAPALKAGGPAQATTDELVRTIDLPDGSQLLVFHRKVKK